jgi:hypothetical protein
MVEYRGDPSGPFGWYAFGLSGHQPNLPAGWSGGGPHALACAAGMPGRVIACATIAGVGRSIATRVCATIACTVSVVPTASATANISGGTLYCSTISLGNAASAGTTSASSIAVDSSGSAYLTGSTTASNFPTAAAAFQTSYPGQQSAFVTKVNTNAPKTGSISYSTYFGGGNFTTTFSFSNSAVVLSVPDFARGVISAAE